MHAGGRAGGHECVWTCVLVWRGSIVLIKIEIDRNHTEYGRSYDFLLSINFFFEVDTNQNTYSTTFSI